MTEPYRVEICGTSTYECKSAEPQPNNYPQPGPSGNTVGLIVPQTSPLPTPPNDQPETEQEKSWWERTKGDLSAAVDDPLAAVVGALKGLANVPSNMGTLLVQGAAMQGGLEMQQAGAYQAALGNEAMGNALFQEGQGVQAAASGLSVPNLVTPPNTPAQRGGDDIATALMMLDAGAGLVKGGVKELAQAGKLVGEGVDAGKVVAEGADTGKAAAEGADATPKTKAAKGSGGGYVAARSLAERVDDKIPKSWGKGKPTRKGDGVRWQDPDNPGNGVRVDAGNPENSQIAQQVDHVVVRSNGQVIGRDGEIISGSIKDNFESAHIPLSEYENWPTWNSPK